MAVQQATFGKRQVIDEPFAGLVVQPGQSRIEIGGVAVHEHGDLPIRRRLMVANPNVSKTPASHHFGCQVHADAAVEIEYKVVQR